MRRAATREASLSGVGPRTVVRMRAARNQQKPSRGSFFGAPGGIRTPNLLIRSQMLYPLSYGRSVEINVSSISDGARGFERAADRRTDPRTGSTIATPASAGA